MLVVSLILERFFEMDDLKRSFLGSPCGERKGRRSAMIPSTKVIGRVVKRVADHHSERMGQARVEIRMVRIEWRRKATRSRLDFSASMDPRCE